MISVLTPLHGIQQYKCNRENKRAVLKLQTCVFIHYVNVTVEFLVCALTIQNTK